VVGASVARPRAVLAAWGLLLVAAALGIGRLPVKTATESVLERGDESWQFYQESLARFGGDELIAVAIEGARPWDPDLLARLPDLTRRFEAIPGVRRVDGLASVPVVEATPSGDLRLDPALGGAPVRTDEEAAAVARRVASDRIAPKSFVSQDGRVFALNVLLDAGAESRSPEIFEAIQGILGSTSAWISGVPVFRVVTDGRTRTEILFFVPLTLVVVALFLFGIFRSLQAVAIPLVTSGVGTALVLGAMGALGVPLTVTTGILPSVLLAIGCAQAMHLLTETAGARNPRELRAAAGAVALPLAYSGLTTALGFAAIAVVPIEALRHLGAFGAFGTLALLAANLSVGTAALRLWPFPARRAPLLELIGGPLRRRVVALVTTRGRLVIAVWIVVSGLFALGVARVEIETDVTRWFPQGGFVRDSYEAIRARLAGISPINVVIASRDGSAVTEPRVLAAIDGLAEHLTALPEVGKVVSLADPLRQIHGGFTGDPARPLPDSRELAEQYLLLLESVAPIHDLVTRDRMHANVMVRAVHNGSEHLLALSRDAEDWWAAHGPPGFAARGTGIMFEFARAERSIALGQLQGLALDLVTIATLLFVIFRRPRLTALAIVPNAMPLLVVFGFLGLAGIPLDAGTVLVGNLAIGIAVDETIFVVNAFFRGQDRTTGAAAAIDAALERVLPALVCTTLAVALGFAVLGFSDFAFTRNLGLLTAGVMVVCVLANATLLPSLLVTFGRRADPEGAASLTRG
jgi:predicted RND superfamily exporter protein